MLTKEHGYHGTGHVAIGRTKEPAWKAVGLDRISREQTTEEGWQFRRWISVFGAYAVNENPSRRNYRSVPHA